MNLKVILLKKQRKITIKSIVQKENANKNKIKVKQNVK